jgi:hypothetical protein
MMETILNPPDSPAPGLLQAIAAAGHTQWTEWTADHSAIIWNVDDAAAVTAIISAYNGSAAELQWWQAQAAEAVAAQYAARIGAGCVITVNGTSYTMALDTASLQHYDAEALTAAMQGQPGIPTWDPAEFWLAADNATQVPIATAAAALAASTAIRAYFKALVKNAATLAGQIAAASSVSAVQAINPSSGWPVN